jgi:hypothetical protein
MAGSISPISSMNSTPPCARVTRPELRLGDAAVGEVAARCPDRSDRARCPAAGSSSRDGPSAASARRLRRTARRRRTARARAPWPARARAARRWSCRRPADRRGSRAAGTARRAWRERAIAASWPTTCSSDFGRSTSSAPRARPRASSDCRSCSRCCVAGVSGPACSRSASSRSSRRYSLWRCTILALIFASICRRRCAARPDRRAVLDLRDDLLVLRLGRPRLERRILEDQPLQRQQALGKRRRAHLLERAELAGAHDDLLRPQRFGEDVVERRDLAAQLLIGAHALGVGGSHLTSARRPAPRFGDDVVAQTNLDRVRARVP